MQTTQYLEKKVQCVLEEYLQREYGHCICILDSAQRVIPILYTHVYDDVSNQFELQISIDITATEIIYELNSLSRPCYVLERLKVPGKTRKDRLISLLDTVKEATYWDWLNIHEEYPSLMNKLNSNGIYELA